MVSTRDGAFPAQRPLADAEALAALEQYDRVIHRRRSRNRLCKLLRRFLWRQRRPLASIRLLEPLPELTHPDHPAMLRAATLFTLALLVAGSAFAQTTVQGTVTDENGQPLPGATVLLVGSSTGDATDVDGRYSFTSTRTGQVTLEASFVGYSASREVVTLSGGTVTQNFELSLDALGLDEVFVTGVVNPVSKLESSVSITTLGPSVLETSPPTTAEIFRQIPGVRSEASGGDGNTNITVRGVPLSGGGAKYLQLQEDGLPVFLFGDIAFATSDIFLRADATLSRIEAIRGGSASTLASNSPAGIINFVTKDGLSQGGSITTTSGLDFRSNRTDFEYGSPFGDDLAFHVGGFYRTGEGPRDAGYTAQQGGQLRGSISKFFDNGFLRVTGKLLNDRTPAYLPQPVIATGTNDDPEFSAPSGLDLNSETSHSVFLLSNFGFGADGERRRVDVADGMHPRSTAIGGELSFDLGNGFSIANKGRFALNSGRFVSPFTAGFGQTADVVAGLPFDADDLDGATLTRAEDGSAFDGELLQTVMMFDTELESFNNVFNDASVSKSFADMGAPVTLTAGLFSGVQRLNMSWLWNSYLMEVAGDNASLIDVTTDDGEVLTEDGLVAYGSAFFGNCCERRYDLTYDVVAPYAAVSAEVTPQLNVDGSVRYDRGNVSGVLSSGVVAAIDVNNDGRISAAEENTGLIDEASRNPVDYDYDYWSFTGGANFKISDASAVFARASRGYSAKADRIFPNTATAFIGVPSGTSPQDRIDQAELGYKQQFNNGGVFVTGFYATTDEAPGFEATTQELLQSSYRAFGVELEGSAAFDLFSVRGALTYTNAEITSGDNDGNAPRRQPDFLYAISPEADFGIARVGLSVIGQTSSYSQNSNELVLPAFTYLDLFASVNLTEGLSLRIAGNNVLDTVGFTEAEDGAITDGATNYVRARSITGRTLTASIRYGF